MKKIALFIACTIVCACSKKDVANTITIDIDNNKNMPELEIKSVIPLETDSNKLIGEITCLTINGNFVYVLDRRYSKTLFQFDLNGIYQNKTAFGKGPHELINPRDFYLDPVNRIIFVWDPESKRMKEFDLMLNYLSSKNYSSNMVLRNFILLDNNYWLAHTANNDYINDSKSTTIKYYDYFVYTNDFKEIKQKFLPFDEKFISVSLVKPISKSKQTLFCRPFDLTLYKLNINYKAEIAYKLDFGKYNLTRSDCEKPMAFIFDKQSKGIITANIQEISNTDEFICFHYAFRGINNYVIYSIYNRKVYLFQNLLKNNRLPNGKIKEILSDNTFVLAVEAQDFIDFCKNKKEYSRYVSKLSPISNPVIITFKITEI